VHSAYNPHSTTVSTTSGVLFPIPEPYSPITTDNLTGQIGLVQDFFASKLAANHGRPLIEDEDLPPKQRFPKPRLGPAGKISSPRKRPLREQQQAAKKRRKLVEMGKSADDAAGAGGVEKGAGGRPVKAVKPIAPLKLDMPEVRKKNGGAVEPEKEGSRNGPMMSPESLTAA